MTEAYNLAYFESGFSGIFRLIPPNEFGIYKKEIPLSVMQIQASYTIKAKKMGSSFIFYVGDYTKSGIPFISTKRNTFTSKIKLKLEQTNQEIEFRRPKDSGLTSKARVFEFNGTQYRWELPYSKGDPHGKLFNCRTQQLIGEYKHNPFQSVSLGNLIIYNCNLLDPTLKTLMIATCYELNLEEREREITSTTG